MNSNSRLTRLLGLISLLLIPVAFATPMKADIFGHPDNSTLKFCQEYDDGYLFLHGSVRSVHYRGSLFVTENERRGTYSSYARGVALLYNSSGCKGTLVDHARFTYREQYTGNSTWWSNTTERFSTQLIIAGIARFDGDKRGNRWHWRAQYLDDRRKAYRDGEQW